MPFISCNKFATLARIRRETASRLFRDFHNGRINPWNGCVLNVQTSNGKGGKSGLHYLVSVDSLPTAFQERLKSSQALVKVPSNIPTLKDANKQEGWWLRQLEPILQPNLSRNNRALLVEEICNRKHTDWNGNPKTISRSTLYARLKKFQTQGIGSQIRKRREDRGNRRVYISKLWDSNVPFENTTKQNISDAITRQIQGYIKSGLVTSKTEVFIRNYLMKQTIGNGFNPNEPNFLERICKVPKYKISEQKRFKNVHRFKSDKKAHYDASPSIKRDWSGLKPMECVVADVHHLNFLINRENGTTATAKMIAFQDMATRRVWSELIFFDKKGGVRNTDVIAVFARMLSDKSWGVPKNLYLDNGSEYRFADYLSDLFNIVYPTTNFKTGECSSKKITAMPIAQAGDHIIRAIAYNSKAKPIEALFGHLEQHFFRHTDGYIGDDRMNPKTPKLGKLPRGQENFDSAIIEFESKMAAYHAFPQSAFLKGKSPNESFQNFVDDGWAATIVEHDDLNAAISKPQSRKVIGDCVKAFNIEFQADELAAYSGDRVVAYIPPYTEFNAIRIETQKGDFICNAIAERTYRYDNREGAKRSSERKKNFDQKIRHMDKSTPTPDVNAEFKKIVDQSIPVTPNEPTDIVSLFGDEKAPPTPLPDNVVPLHATPKSNEEVIELNKKMLPNFDWRKPE